MKNINKNLLIIIMLLSFSACEEYLEVEPEGIVSTDIFFENARDVVSMVNSAYGALAARSSNSGTALYNGPIWNLMDAASDDAHGSQDVDNLTFDATNGDIRTYWNGCYRGIYRCNTVIDRLPSSPFNGGTEELRTQLMGEVYYLRALNYFNLVRAFGDVPLIVNEIRSLSNVQVSKENDTEIYDQIEADLKNAISMLPDQYTGTTRFIAQEIGRATRYAATALLAKVYLYQGNYALAADSANVIIQSGIYGLHNDYTANFQGNNENGIESIFEIQHSNDLNAGSFSRTITLGAAFPTDEDDPSNSNPNIFGSGLVQAFEPGDTRRAMITNNGETQGNGFPAREVNNKFRFDQPEGGQHASSVNWPLMRYAEILLIFAEAENERSGGPTSAAYDAINQVRARAFQDNLHNLPSGLDQSQFRQAVWEENRRELFGEGHRWYELVRTNRFVEVMSLHLGKTVPENYTVLPIPQIELDLNPELTQNELWIN
ncbi:MAG: RagB/SusD family nutrient uptake outer membrane protein [Cyclobacteriaceae bacterium]